MKLKRFLSLAVSLAMVIAMIPAFSLTASAASTTTVIDALGGEVLCSAPMVALTIQLSQMHFPVGLPTSHPVM